MINVKHVRNNCKIVSEDKKINFVVKERVVSEYDWVDLLSEDFPRTKYSGGKKWGMTRINFSEIKFHILSKVNFSAIPASLISFPFILAFPICI